MTGRDHVAFQSLQLRAELYPRRARFADKELAVSCPHESTSPQFLIYPSSLSSILSHSLLWGVPRRELPEPVPSLPVDGARSI